MHQAIAEIHQTRIITLPTRDPFPGFVSVLTDYCITGTTCTQWKCHPASLPTSSFVQISFINLRQGSRTHGTCLTSFFLLFDLIRLAACQSAAQWHAPSRPALLPCSFISQRRRTWKYPWDIGGKWTQRKIWCAPHRQLLVINNDQVPPQDNERSESCRCYWPLPHKNERRTYGVAWWEVGDSHRNTT